MRIDNKQLNSIYDNIRFAKKRNLLKIMAQSEPITFTEMKDLLDKKGGRSNVTAYHLRHLMNSNLIKKDKTGYYILTRFGVQVVDLITQFENICLTYDISDCDKDGEIKLIIQRNLGRKKIEATIN